MIRKHANPQRQKADEWSPGERDMGVTRSDYYQDCGFLGSVKKMSGIRQWLWLHNLANILKLLRTVLL